MSTLEQLTSITLQDIKVSLSEAGKGEAILCLHGNPGYRKVFSNMMTKLDGLNIKLIAPDRPGHNSTDELNFDNNLWFDTSIYADLIDHKLNKKAWILGYDYGCLPALKVAIKHPEKVKGLIFINPYIAPNANDKTSLIPNFAKGPLTGSILGIFLPNQYYQIFGDLLNNTFLPETGDEDYVDNWLQRFTKFENIIAYLLDKNIQIKIQDELKEEMKKISLPVFTLFGGKDALTNNQTQQEIISLIPNAKFETSEANGHYMPYLNPEICVQFIKKTIGN